MNRNRCFAATCLLLALTAPPAFAVWPAGGVHLVRPAPSGSSGQLSLGPDGVGGAYVVWAEADAANAFAFRVHRLDAEGNPPAGWTTTGVRACSLATFSFPPLIRPDGTGGAYFVWTDYPPITRVTRIDPDGTVNPGWPAAGLTAASAAGQADVVATDDGEGGVLIAWRRNASGTTSEILTQRFRANGTRATGFPAAGLPLTFNVAGQKGKFRPRLVRDANRGFWVSYTVIGLDTMYIPSSCAVAHLDTTGRLDQGQLLNGTALTLPAGEVGTLTPYAPVALALDGAGGVFAFTVGGNGNVRGFHVLSSLDEDAGWPPGGVVIAGGAGWPSNFFPDDENWPVAAGDLAGTACVGWRDANDFLLHGSRMDLTGAIVAGWSGAPVLNGEMQDAFVADPAGLFVAGMVPNNCAHFNCTGPMLVVRMNADGSVAPGWPADNLPTTAAPGVLLAYGAPFDGPRLTADGAGGVIAAWIDYPEYYAARFAAAGPVTAVAPNPEPSATRVRARFEPGDGVRVSFASQDAADARIELLDVSGRRIAGSRVTGGTGAVVLPGTRDLAAGLYFVRFTGERRAASAKVAVVR